MNTTGRPPPIVLSAIPLHPEKLMRAIDGFLGTAVEYCAETGRNPDDFVTERLYPDMAPFHFPIEAAWHHSVWDVQALLTGESTRPTLEWEVPFARLRAMIIEAERQLMAFTQVEIDACAGKALYMQFGPRRLAFTAESFILSFSHPNFHFHAVAAMTSCLRPLLRSMALSPEKAFSIGLKSGL